MRKTLLLAAALACSSAAQADIWTCTSTAGASLGQRGLIQEGKGGLTWVADTRRGMRFPSPIEAGSEYLGECEDVSARKNNKVIYCTATYEMIGSRISLLINELTTGEIIFTASELNTFGRTSAGNCIKI